MIKKIFEKFKIKRFLNQVLGNIKKEIILADVRLFLFLKEIEDIENYLKKDEVLDKKDLVGTTPYKEKEKEETEKLLELKKEELEKTKKQKINLRVQFLRIKDYIKNFK